MENFVEIPSSRIMGTEAGKVTQGLKSTGYSSRGAMFKSQHPHWWLPVVGNCCPTDLLGHFTHVVHGPTWRQNMNTHETLKKLSER